MIQPLRKIHRLIFLGLAIALPLLFIAALAVRQAPPTNPAFSKALMKP